MPAQPHQPSRVANSYPPSAIRTVFERVAQVEGVTKLTVGEPDFDTPEHITQAAIDSLQRQETRYSGNAGIPEFREALASHYSPRLNRPLAPENIMVAVGGMEALYLALCVAVDRGDDVLVPDPAYPNYHGQLHLLGANAVPLPLDADQNFSVTAAGIAAALTPRTRAVILNSPSNPLGTTISHDELSKIAALADAHDFLIISDEVYDRIVYDGNEHTSIAQVSPQFNRYLIVNSLSKSYAMTGWRIGFVIGPAELIAPMPRMQEGITSCLPVFIQRAGIAALTGPDEATQSMVASYQRRRDLIVDGLSAIPGISCTPPSGAFYAFADIRETGLSSDVFAERLLVEHKIAVIPGTAFGARGEGFIRLSFAASDETISTALAGISTFVQSL